MVSYHGLRGACSCSSCCCCCSACHHTLRASIMSVSIMSLAIRSVASMCVSPCKPQCFLLRQASMRRCRHRLRMQSVDAAACVSPSERKRESQKVWDRQREREPFKEFQEFWDHLLFYDVGHIEKKNFIRRLYNTPRRVMDLNFFV
jgi:hypothetical protein